MRDFTDGPLVQANTENKTIAGTPLARGLHSALLRGGGAYDPETNVFSYKVTEDFDKARQSLTNMVKRQAYPVTGTYATALDVWYPKLGGQQKTINDNEAIVFRDAAMFAKAIKGLAAIEDAVRFEPERLIRNPNAIYARTKLQELGAVYLEPDKAYLPLNRAKIAEINLTVDKASEPTAIQKAFITVAIDMVKRDPDLAADADLQTLVDTMPATNTISASYTRAEATEYIAELSKTLGPELEAAVEATYPNLYSDSEATLNAARIAQMAKRAAELMTGNATSAISAESLGTIPLSKIEQHLASGNEVTYTASNDVATELQEKTIKRALQIATEADADRNAGKDAKDHVSILGNELAARMRVPSLTQTEATQVINELSEKMPFLEKMMADAHPDLVAADAKLNSATPLQMATIAQALSYATEAYEQNGKIKQRNPNTLLGKKLYERASAETFNRTDAAQLIVDLQKKLPLLRETVEKNYPDLVAAEASLAAPRLVNARLSAPLPTSDRAHAESRRPKPKSIESDYFKEREKGRRLSIEINPLPETDPKHESLSALGMALREMDEKGEATFREWRLATKGEIVFAPVAAKNRDWVIQRNDDGIGIIHDTKIFEALRTKKQTVMLDLIAARFDRGAATTENTPTTNNAEQIAELIQTMRSVEAPVLKTTSQADEKPNVAFYFDVTKIDRIKADEIIALSKAAFGKTFDVEFKQKFPDFTDRKTPFVLEDLRFPIRLGTTVQGMTILEQPRVDLSREPLHDDIQWAIGYNPGEKLDVKEQQAQANAVAKSVRQQERMLAAYAGENIREARNLASIEITRKGLDSTQIKFLNPEPTTLGTLLRGEKIAQTRDNSYTAFHLLPRPEGRNPKVLIVDTVSLGMTNSDLKDLRKGDYLAFGFEKVIDQIVPVNVHRIPSPEQTAAMAATKAANTVNLALRGESDKRVPDRIVNTAIQKFTEWHRGKTGFEPHSGITVVDPEPSKTYSGPIIGIAGRYAIQNLGPDDHGSLQVMLTNLEMVKRDDLSKMHPDMVVTLAYHQSERGLTNPIDVTDARPLRDLGLALDKDLANELHLNNPGLAKNIERGLGIARRTNAVETAERIGIFTQWSGKEVPVKEMEMQRSR